MLSGMKERKKPVAKQKPGQKLRVSGYTLLYTNVPTMPAMLCMDPTAANIFPAKRDKRSRWNLAILEFKPDLLHWSRSPL